MTLDLATCEAIPGWMEESELQWLYDRAHESATVVEVGCWKGRSTSALAQGCKGQVFTVDTFEGSPSERETTHAEALERNLYDEAVTNLAPFRNVAILRMESRAAARLFRPGSVDMVFIDGEHTRPAVLADLLLWHPKVLRLLCGHDLGMDGVEAALALFGLPFERGPGSLWFAEVLR